MTYVRWWNTIAKYVVACVLSYVAIHVLHLARVENGGCFGHVRDVCRVTCLYEGLVFDKAHFALAEISHCLITYLCISRDSLEVDVRFGSPIQFGNLCCQKVRVDPGLSY